MKDTADVKRWMDGVADVPDELARLLRASRDELGTPDEVAELARRLSSVLGPASGLPGEASVESGDARTEGPAADAGGHAPSTSARAPGAAANRWAGSGVRSLARKGAWVVAGGGAVIGSWLLAAGPSGGPDALPLGSVQRGSEPAGIETVAPPAPVAAPSAPSLPAASPIGVAPDAALPAPNPARAGAGGSPAATPPRARASAPVARSRPPSLAEAELLGRAQAALGSAPAVALELAQRHERRFPRGALVQEREVIAIEALKRLGRHDAATSRAAAFERRYRGSLHRSRALRGSDTPAPSGDGSPTAR